MAIDYQILAERGLVYVRYAGNINLDESAEAIARYARDPLCKVGQHQLVDLSRVTGWDVDYAKLLKLQAHKADVFRQVRHEVMLVYYAPTPIPQKIAQTVIRSWEGVPGMVPLIQETEAGALSVLGQPETSFDRLLQNA